MQRKKYRLNHKFQKISILPTKFSFALDHQFSWNFHCMGCLSYFSTPWNPLEIIVVSKKLLHYIARAIINDNFFFFFLQYKDKKIHIFIHVNTLSNDFKDVLR